MTEVGPAPAEEDGPPALTPLAQSEAPPALSNDPSLAPPFTHTRASGFWAAVVVGLLVLVLLIIFILENGQRASVSFFGAHGHLPEGVALLLAAVIGGLFVVAAAVARILELRRRAARQHRGVAPEQVRRWRRPKSRPGPSEPISG
ncbi:MAG: lipopolysaccharide assembly protein LapA domain-containing protein [Acidimicrobiales bacterium]|jgi:uncharacterized integral membrane protein